MNRIFFLVYIFISISLGFKTLEADVLVNHSLKAPAREYGYKNHPHKSAKGTRFDIPGAGFLRINYIDLAYNSAADSGGLSWRNVPGATNYAKSPGKTIKMVKKPKHPKTGSSYQWWSVEKIERPMKDITILLTPRHRQTWSGGGYQYATNLRVKVEWSPHQFEIRQEKDIIPPKQIDQPKPSSKTRKIFNNGNGYGVSNCPLHSTVVKFNTAFLIESIVNYHYNGGRGDTPGTISLVSSNGKIYGPWSAVSKTPNGSDPRKYWTVFPKIIVPAGTYRVIDSNPLTWAQNSQSGNKGMCWIMARPIN